MTNRWCKVGITEVIYEESGLMKRHQRTVRIFDENVWGHDDEVRK